MQVYLMMYENNKSYVSVKSWL